MDCIFCKIINKEERADILYEDERVVAFKDINPVAPVHILVVTKKHIPSVDHLELSDKELVGDLFLAAQKIARDVAVAKSGYKLSFNVGRGGGQLIDHLHLHLVGGWKTAMRTPSSSSPSLAARSEKDRKLPGLP